MARLEKIVEAIEQGKVGLEESIERFSEGMELIGQCRSILSEAELKIQKLQVDTAGNLEAGPMSEPAGDDDV